MRGGAFDDVFWTAETPSLAQSYIPRAGSKRIISIPGEYMLDDGLRPTTPDDPVMGWALERCGAVWGDLEIEHDGRRVQSWRNLPGWPCYRDMVEWISTSLGYGLPADRVWQVSCDRQAGGCEVFRPASWSMPGQLFILHIPDLQISDPPWSEEGRWQKPHNRVQDFHDFAEQGLEAFHMSDLLQSDYLGNVHHRSIGLLPAALARARWIAIPASRHDGPDPGCFTNPMTREFERFLAGLDHDCPLATCPAP